MELNSTPYDAYCGARSVGVVRAMRPQILRRDRALSGSVLRIATASRTRLAEIGVDVEGTASA